MIKFCGHRITEAEGEGLLTKGQPDLNSKTLSQAIEINQTTAPYPRAATVGGEPASLFFSG